MDVVAIVLHPDILLIASDCEEWGDSRKEEFYFYMKFYSLVDNIQFMKELF